MADLSGRTDLSGYAELAGQRALVTGGTRGIGKAIALALAGWGAEVTACYRADHESAEQTAKQLAGTPGGGIVVQADLGDAAQVAGLVAGQRSRGKLDILVSNAGIDAVAGFSEIDEDEWQRVLEANLSGNYRVIRASSSLLARGARVVLIGSAAAGRGMLGRSHYGAAKTGLIGLNRALAKELGSRGIRVNLLCPGIIATEPDAGLPPFVLNQITASTALGRLGTPDEVAGAVLYLASDLSAYTTGSTLVVDGGI